jgi:hypothetical protein
MVTGDRVILGTKRSAIYSLTCTCAMTPTTLILHVFPPHLPYWQLPCYSISVLVMGTILSIFTITFRSLLTAATLLNKCFKVRNSSIRRYEETSYYSVCLYSLTSSYNFLGKLFYWMVSSPLISSKNSVELKKYCKFFWVNLTGMAFVQGVERKPRTA